MGANGSSFKAVPGRIPGTAVNLGGIDFVMPPLNLDQVREFEAVIPTLGKRDTMAENLAEALPVIHAALSRNYPDLAVDDLRSLIDLGNFRAVCEALVTSSGYVPAAPGEPRPPSP